MTELITILGPTACGKTEFAAHLAANLGTEIISADSRQMYRRMDIGTGKDLSEYDIEGQHIPYHLIDIVEPGYKYNLFEYQRDFLIAYNQIHQKGKTPILCGGTGLYIESVLKGYRLSPVPENSELRASLADKSLAELVEILKQYKTLHNVSDLDTVKRAIRAIEIADYYKKTEKEEIPFPKIGSVIIGLEIDRESRRKKITQRLDARLHDGLVEEVKGLIDSGINPEDLIYYGLEYKYVTNYIIGNISYQEMHNQLEIAIHQFAKRQMTWFRGMEKRGIHINWIDTTQPMDKKLKQAIELINKN
ncbi:MAG: tRNA (adenosine(37)-N6)-dimethylallyltransferase MiaA [Paludibacteraceae bacterium]|jgi:tRNA dimethylallyltransferase|nr:tRNA (adenosine(37)-N6)-dimethylallyltransferase MiaA [Paludibacteraceae bacterium]